MCRKESRLGAGSDPNAIQSSCECVRPVDTGSIAKPSSGSAHARTRVGSRALSRALFLMTKTLSIDPDAADIMIMIVIVFALVIATLGFVFFG